MIGAVALAAYWANRQPVAPARPPALVAAPTPGATPERVLTPTAAPKPTLAAAPTATPPPTPDRRWLQARAWIEKARNEVKSISDDDRDSKAIVLADIAAAQAHAGDVAGSRQSFSSAFSNIESWSSHQRDDAQRSFAAAQARAGDVAAALQTAEKLPPRSKSLALADIAAAQAHAGDAAGSQLTFTDAVKLAGSLHNKDDRSVVFAHRRHRAGPGG